MLNDLKTPSPEHHHVLRDPLTTPHQNHHEEEFSQGTEKSSLFSYHKTYTAFLLVTISAIGFYVVFSTPKPRAESYVVTMGPIKQYVKVTGNVETIEDANLSFQTSGNVSFVGVKTGDSVTQGKILATLSAGDAQATLLQAEANFSAAQALLQQLKNGARQEEIAIKEQNLENAKNSLSQSYSSLPDSIQNVDAITSDIVKNKFAPLFSYSENKYSLSFTSCDQKLQTEVEIKRNLIEGKLALFQTKTSVITAISSQEIIDSTFEEAYQASLATNELINQISTLLLTPCSLSNEALTQYRSILSGVKVTITGLFSDISIKRTTLIASKNLVSQAIKDLALTKAGSDPYKIKAQASVVEQAKAVVRQAQSGLNKTILKAPFNGTISNVLLSLGETVSPGKTVISMFTLEGYQIEAKIPEVDIVKVKVGDTAEVTLDAYGKQTIFPATVTRINPTATTEGTVPVYTAIITFLGNDERVKQGMSANINILTNIKENTVLLPARYVKLVDANQGTVRKLGQNGQEQDVTISFGIRGEDGMLEVLSGLVMGDLVVPPTTTVRKAQKENIGSN